MNDAGRSTIGGGRIALGAAYLVGRLVLWVGIPLAGRAALAAVGVAWSAPPVDLVLGGVVLAALGAARWVVRPTRAFGPVALIAALAAVAYILLLAGSATFVLPIGDAGLTVDVGPLFDLLAVVPAIEAVAAGVTIVGDFRPRRAAPGPGASG